MPRPKRLTLTDAVVHKLVRYPDWSSTQIAASLGTSSAYVRAVKRRFFPQPKRRQNMPKRHYYSAFVPL